MDTICQKDVHVFFIRKLNLREAFYKMLNFFDSKP